MSLMGTEALEALWALFKDRLSREEQTYIATVSAETQEEGAAVMTVSVQRQFQICMGQIFIPKDDVSDTVNLPEGFRPAADYAMTGYGFSVGTTGAVMITTPSTEDRLLMFGYFTADGPPADKFTVGGGT